MAEQLFSGLIVAAALAMLVRLALGERGRARVARFWSDAGRRLARKRPPPPAPPDARDAARIAEEAIRRARGTSAVRTGNVIRPDAFHADKDRKKRDLH
jgi:hypothetical protein